MLGITATGTDRDVTTQSTSYVNSPQQNKFECTVCDSIIIIINLYSRIQQYI
jgi:hypothetical protein